MEAPKGAQLILATTPLTDSEAWLKRFIDAGIRAFIFPGILLTQGKRLRDLTDLARALCRNHDDAPVLLAIGGDTVAHSYSPLYPYLPLPLSLAASRKSSSALAVGKVLGSLLVQAGIDLVFAPRLDLATDPKIQQGVMSLFGQEASTVSKYGLAFAQGLSEAGVIPCAGTFPGIGTMVLNTKTHLNVITTPQNQLLESDMQPFAKAIKQGMPALIVSRALVPALEPDNIPAAMSPKVVGGYLRGKLRYDGLVIGAGVDDYLENPIRGAFASVQAGCDLQLVKDPELALSLAHSFREGCSKEELLPPELIKNATERLSKLLHKHQTKSSKKQQAISAQELQSISKKIIEESATKIHGDYFPNKQEKIFVLIFTPPSGSSSDLLTAETIDTLRAELPQAIVNSLPCTISEYEGHALLDSIAAHSDCGRAIVFSYEAHLRPSQESLTHIVQESFKEVAVIATRSPYDVAFFPRAQILGAVYNFSPAGIRTAIRLCFDRNFKARGVYPVSVIGFEI